MHESLEQHRIGENPPTIFREVSVKKTFIIISLLNALFLSTPARSDVFNPLQLPKGAQVTIAQPAVTEVPIGMLVNFGATDRDQTLRLLPIFKGAYASKPLTIYIYDSLEKEVKVIMMQPNVPVFYRFKSLNTVSIRPEIASGDFNSQVKLEVQSNSPTTIFH